MTRKPVIQNERQTAEDMTRIRMHGWLKQNLFSFSHITISDFAGLARCFWPSWSYSYLWFDIWHWQWWLQLACMLLTITMVLNYTSHPLTWNGVWSSSVILLLVPVAFCNLLQCLCSLSHFNITVLLQFELQDKVLFHFVGLTYWVAHVSRYLSCFVLSMNYLEASKNRERVTRRTRPVSLSLSLGNLSQMFNLVC